MTILSSELLLNSLSQIARLCDLAVMTRDLQHAHLLRREFKSCKKRIFQN